MMTFKQHIELSEAISTYDDISVYLENFEIVKRLEMLREINDTYPIGADSFVSELMSETFTCYDNVFDLVLGQFIMIEQILTGKFKFEKESDLDIELMTYLIRPKDEVEFDNQDSEREAELREQIMATPVKDLYGLLNKFLNDRENILFHQFSGVFYSKEDPEEEPDTFSTPAPDELFNQQWYWYSMVRMLAQEDIRRYDEIYMLKMNTVLPEMSYLAQKNKIEAANARQQAALNRL